MRDRHHHVFFGDEILHVDVADLFAVDLRAAIVSVLLRNLGEVGLDDREDLAFVAEDAEIIDDLVEQFGVFRAELLLLQVDQLTERHPQDGVGLDGRERVSVRLAASFVCEVGVAGVAQGALHQRGRALDRHQPGLRLGLRRRRPNDADHFVDVRVREQQAFDRVLPLPRSLQQELRPATNDRHAMPQVLLQHLLDVERSRLAVDQRQEDDRERVLQRRELIELVEHDVGVGVALDFENQTNRLFQIAFVAIGRDAFDLFVVDQFSNPLDDPIARLLVGNFRDDDSLAVLAELFDASAGADQDRTAAREVAATDAAATADDAAGRKVGAFDDLEQFVDRDFRLVEHLDRGRADLAEVMRRHARRHADRDAAGAVDEQVWELRRQDRRFESALVVGRHEVDGVELDVVHHRRGDRRHPRFRISHGGRGETGDRTEVSLLVDQHVPHVPVLGHADERGVDDAFAVRMVVTARVAGDLGALHAARPGRQVQVVHGDENAPLRRLQSVADVGQGATDDDAHRVRQIAFLEFVLDRQIVDRSHHRLPGRNLFAGRFAYRFNREIVVRFVGQNAFLPRVPSPQNRSGNPAPSRVALPVVKRHKAKRRFYRFLRGFTTDRSVV